MKKICVRLFFLLILFCYACSPINILNTEAADNFRLSQYQTFDFFEVDATGDALGTNYQPQVELIKQELTQQLEQRGLTRSTAAPDLKINLGIVVSQQVQTRQTDIRTDPPRYVGQRRYTWQTREVEVGRYREGTLSVHLVDNQRNELVWRGAAESVVPNDPSKVERRIAEGVKELVERIPQ